MKPCFSWLCILRLDYFMSIRIQALIKTFPMVWVVTKSLVHEKSLVANNTVLHLIQLFLWGRMCTMLGSYTLSNHPYAQSFWDAVPVQYPFTKFESIGQLKCKSQGGINRHV